MDSAVWRGTYYMSLWLKLEQLSDSVFCCLACFCVSRTFRTTHIAGGIFSQTSLYNSKRIQEKENGDYQNRR